MRPRDTLETRRKKRRSMCLLNGHSETQAAEMLDLYLGGDSMKEIAAAYGVSQSAAYNQCAREALYRLMDAKAAERLEELEDLK